MNDVSKEFGLHTKSETSKLIFIQDNAKVIKQFITQAGLSLAYLTWKRNPTIMTIEQLEHAFMCWKGGERT